MGAWSWPTEMGGLSHDGESLIWGGAHPLDLQRLWDAPELEVDNHRHPGVDGSLPRRALIVERVVELKYLLNATVLADGTATDNPAAGAFSNHRELIERVGSPATWDGEATAITLTDPLGGQWTADVQMWVSPMGVERGGAVPVTLTIVNPSGVLVEVGS